MTQYATKADLASRYNVTALTTSAPTGFTATTIVSDAVIDVHLQDASSIVDSYIATQVRLPLSAPYHQAIVMYTCQIAMYHIMIYRGWQPDTAKDDIIVLQYQSAIKTLQTIADGRNLHMIGIGADNILLPYSMNTVRGW